MSKYVDPVEAFDEGRFLEGDKDLPKADKPKATKKKTKKQCSACGQQSLTGSTYGG